MLATQQQKSLRFIKWWVIANLVALPLLSCAIFFILAIAAWFVAFESFDLDLWMQTLPYVTTAGGVCGLVIGLLQGLVLNIKGIKVFDWTLATTLGMAISITLVYAGWHLVSLVESITLLWNIPLQLSLYAQITIVLLAVFQGCPMALLQWRVLRFECYFTLASWPWVAGLTWGLLTPSLLMIIFYWWQTTLTNWLYESLFLFFPFLLFPLPYIVVTTMLWKRRGV